MVEGIAGSWLLLSEPADEGGREGGRGREGMHGAVVVLPWCCRCGFGCRLPFCVPRPDRG